MAEERTNLVSNSVVAWGVLLRVTYMQKVLEAYSGIDAANSLLMTDEVHYQDRSPPESC